MIQLDQEHTMAPILDTIIDHIPAPVDNSDEPLHLSILLDYNDFVGRIGIGRFILVKAKDQVSSKLMERFKNSVHKLFWFPLVWNVEIQEAKVGDLIAISGMEDIFVEKRSHRQTQLFPILHIDGEPTLQMTFLVNHHLLVAKENGDS